MIHKKPQILTDVTYSSDECGENTREGLKRGKIWYIYLPNLVLVRLLTSTGLLSNGRQKVRVRVVSLSISIVQSLHKNTRIHIIHKAS
jgi:hypothetical protein